MTTESFTDIDLATVDLTDLTYFQDGPPHEIFARMRTAPGPHWNALTDADEPGFWSFTKFDDIQTISSNPELFSSARGGVFFTATMGAAPVEVLREVILGMDPPRHTHQRGVVQAASAHFGFDAAPFLRLLDLRENKVKPREVDPVPLLGHYMRQIQVVIDAVDRLEK